MSKRGIAAFAAALVVAAVAAAVIAALLLSIHERKLEAKDPYLKVVRVGDETTDSAPWGSNWPRQYDSYQRTADMTHTSYGGSEGAPATSRLEMDPWLVRMFAGYAFALDFRERRGHAYMLQDQEQTRRVTERPQPGACLHCHASVIPTYRRLGGGDVHAGFVALGKLSYRDAHAEVVKTGSANPVPHGDTQALEHADGAHPVGCVDCHDPQTMALRVTRPGMLDGLAALAAGEAPVPHLPSLSRWREGSRAEAYDPNRDASRQEMRSLVCGQCHVEYYCGPKLTLFFPWANGLRVEQIEATYDATKFEDGHRFYDWQHAETGAEALKAQHPEFETWSQGIHARAGVACADCHMPYQREGALKVSDHWVRSPLLNVARACQTCHPVAEAELLSRVATIQDRTHELMQRSAGAMLDMLDAITAAQRAGAKPEQLADALALQRKAQWRLDFVNAENSMGFHAPQESARILAESIDYARRAQIAALEASRGGAAQAAFAGQD
jgi:nitrite reductase (cytochrome c-552)